MYHNMNLAADRRDWKSMQDQISRLGNLVMDLKANAAPQA